MGSFIGLISICLNIAAFYWILILTGRIKNLEAKTSQFDPEELDTHLSVYLDAVREENANLLNEVDARLKQSGSELRRANGLKKKPTTPVDAPPQWDYAPERLIEEHPSTDLQPNEGREKHEDTNLSLSKRIDSNSAPMSIPENPIDSLETSMLARILQLKQEGLESEDIAKKLGLGKGEVALMLKLHEKR